MSPDLVDHVLDFVLIKSDYLPSNHAPIILSMNNPEAQLDSIWQGRTAGGSRCGVWRREKVRFADIIEQKFAVTLSRTNTSNSEMDVNSFATNISNTLCKCATGSRCTDVLGVSQGNVHLGWWERVLCDAADVRVTKAVSWKEEAETQGVIW